MTPREQKESVCGFKNKEKNEEEEKKKRRKKNYFTKHCLQMAFLIQYYQQFVKRKERKTDLFFILSSISQPENVIL